MHNHNLIPDFYCVELGGTDPGHERNIAEISISSSDNEEEIIENDDKNLFKLPFMPSSVHFVVDNMNSIDKVKLQEELGVKHRPDS